MSRKYSHLSHSQGFWPWTMSHELVLINKSTVIISVYLAPGTCQSSLQSTKAGEMDSHFFIKSSLGDMQMSVWPGLLRYISSSCGSKNVCGILCLFFCTCHLYKPQQQPAVVEQDIHQHIEKHSGDPTFPHFDAINLAQGGRFQYLQVLLSSPKGLGNKPALCSC